MRRGVGVGVDCDFGVDHHGGVVGGVADHVLGVAGLVDEKNLFAVVANVVSRQGQA